MRDWIGETLRLSFVLLLTSAILVLLGRLGFGSSPPLAGALVLVAAGLFSARRRLRAVGPIAGWRAGRYLLVSWLGPLVAAALVVFASGATPAEVEALGGLAGFAAMVNYFLRPVYFAITSLYQYFAGLVRS